MMEVEKKLKDHPETINRGLSIYEVKEKSIKATIDKFQRLRVEYRKKSFNPVSGIWFYKKYKEYRKRINTWERKDP